MVIPAVAAGAMAAMGFVGPMFVHSLFSIIISSSPLAEAFRQRLNPLYPIQIPGPGDFVGQRLLGVIDADAYKGKMLLHGFNDTQAENLFAGAERLLTGAELVFANYRGIIDDATYQREMQRQAYSEASATTFKEVNRYFPSPIDLVRFAVREVYTPAIVEEYGQMEDLPDIFLKEAGKAGLPQEQAMNYWAAHWELPSVQMGYDMLHRGIINEEQLRTLLRVQDVMPFWREPLIKLSYRPLTRVDVRRMYRIGILDRDGVFRAYKELGYNDERAGNMTEFTIAYETQQEKSLSAAEILRAFTRHVLTRDECKAWLMDSGYPDEIAEVKIAIEEAKLIQDETDDRIDALTEQYVDGMLTIEALQNQIGLMELPAEQAVSVIAAAQRKKQRAIKMPSISDVRKWIDEGLITRDDGAAILTKLNIPTEYIAFYLGEKKRLPSISDVRRWYADETIDEAKAKGLLTQLNVPPEFIGYYLVEKAKLPSVSDVRGWVQTGVIDKARGEELLTLLKVPADYLPLYLSEKSKLPSIKDVQTWLSDGSIDEATAKKLLTQLQIPDDLQDFYMKQKMRVPTVKDVQNWLKQGMIDRSKAEGILTSLGYDSEYIKLYCDESEAAAEEAAAKQGG
jgi:hypothetical protein